MATPSQDPEALKEKLRAWREGEASIAFTFGNGYSTRKDFMNLPSKFQQERDQIRDMTEAGIAFERA